MKNKFLLVKLILGLTGLVNVLSLQQAELHRAYAITDSDKNNSVELQKEILNIKSNNIFSDLSLKSLPEPFQNLIAEIKNLASTKINLVGYFNSKLANDLNVFDQFQHDHLDYINRYVKICNSMNELHKCKHLSEG